MGLTGFDWVARQKTIVQRRRQAIFHRRPHEGSKKKRQNKNKKTTSTTTTRYAGEFRISGRRRRENEKKNKRREGGRRLVSTCGPRIFTEFWNRNFHCSFLPSDVPQPKKQSNFNGFLFSFLAVRRSYQ